MIGKLRRALAFVIGGLLYIVTFGLVEVNLRAKSMGTANDDPRNRSTLGQPLDEKHAALSRRDESPEPDTSGGGRTDRPRR